MFGNNVEWKGIKLQPETGKWKYPNCKQVHKHKDKYIYTDIDETSMEIDTRIDRYKTNRCTCNIKRWKDWYILWNKKRQTCKQTVTFNKKKNKTLTDFTDRLTTRSTHTHLQCINKRTQLHIQDKQTDSQMETPTGR